MSGTRKNFGLRAPPPEKPEDGGPPPLTPIQKRTVAIVLATAGALSLGVYALVELQEECEPDPNDPQKEICHHSRGWHSSSSSWPRSRSSSSSGSSWHSVSFGGFGSHGSSHGGGS